MDAVILFPVIGTKDDAADMSGSLHAKLGALYNKSAIKSIQRGVVLLSNDQRVQTATISTVDINKAMVNFLGAAAGSAYETVAYTSHHFVRLNLVNASTINVFRSSHHDREVSVSYEVIEFY